MLKGTHCVTMLFNCVIPGVLLRHVHHPFEGPSKTKLEQELESVALLIAALTLVISTLSLGVGARVITSSCLM